MADINRKPNLGDIRDHRYLGYDKIVTQGHTTWIGNDPILHNRYGFDWLGNKKVTVENGTTFIGNDRMVRSGHSIWVGNKQLFK
jgi:hypothetical protein